MVIPSAAASREMSELCIDLHDVSDILENGYDCPKSKRAKGVVERCVRRGKKTIKVVAVESFSRWLNEEIWLITHAGG